MRRALFLAFDDVETLDLTGPWEVFAVASRLRAPAPFELCLAAPGGGEVRTRDGLRLVADADLESAPAGEVLVVPGGRGTRAGLHDDALLDWIRERSRAAELTLSVCTGSLLLAAAGLLTDRPATTHFSLLDRLRELEPTADVAEGVRYAESPGLITTAGVAAGVDGALRAVELLEDPELAAATAAHVEWPTPRP